MAGGPDGAWDRFKAKTANLPRTTEAERWVIQRIGQAVFRAALLDYWDSRCPLTGVTDPAWSDCNDERRLDVDNGLLLSVLWDAAFDQGLVSFADDGTPLFGPKLSETARKTLGAGAISPLRGLRASHRRTSQRIVRGVVSRTEMARKTSMLGRLPKPSRGGRHRLLEKSWRCHQAINRNLLLIH
jgi:hypothetical protein